MINKILLNLNAFLSIPYNINSGNKKEGIIQFGAVVNDSANTDNLNFVIIGMVVVILVLVGAAMFAPKK